MRIGIVCIMILLGLTLTGSAQLRIDTIPIKKRFLRAGSELLITELLPWSFNRFVRNAEFAKVNFKSIGTNLKPSSWEWDDNNFKTNQFAHPYHGNLYYSTFRTNGYSFWQSAPAAFAGSFLWEIAGETHFPAPNDFINTSFGGISLGEMTYRISNKIVNNSAHGIGRQLQEVVALIINPVNGLNRILDGQWGRVYGDTDTTALVAYLNVGMRHFNIRTLEEYTKGRNELYLRLRLQYGDRFKTSNIPFESFYAQVEAGGGDSTYLNTVQVIGALKTWTLKEQDDQLHLYSVTMNYDFIKNNAFQYGGQSFTFRLLSDWFRKSKTKLYTEIGSGIVVLGAVPDKYLYYGEGRNYDYGPGISLTTSVFLNLNNRFEAELNYKGSRFKTVNGNKSSFILNTLSADVRVNVIRDFSVAAGIGQYTLNGFYKGFRNVAEIYPFARFSVGYKFD